MDVGRVSGWLSAAGSMALLAGAAVVVFVRFGGSAEYRVLPSGRQSLVEHRSSLWESQHEVALRVLIAVVVVSLVAAALVRFAGRLGGALVVVVGGLGVLASLLSVGPFLVPGVGLLAASALTAELARQEGARSHRRPPPPPVISGPRAT